MTLRITAALLCVACLLTESRAARADVPKPPTRQSLALVAITRGEGFSQGEIQTLQELLLNALDATGRFKVIGQSDIDAILTLEAKKEAVGCTDTGCMVQIAGALGVDLVATADVGKLGDNTLLTLKVITVRTATVAARAQTTVLSVNDLPRAARTLAGDIVLGMDGRAVVAEQAATPAPRQKNPALRIRGFVLIGLAVAAGGIATGLGLEARAAQASLHTTPRPGADAQKLLQMSNTDALATDGLIGTGVVLGAVGIGLAAAF